MASQKLGHSATHTTANHPSAMGPSDNQDSQGPGDEGEPVVRSDVEMHRCKRSFHKLSEAGRVLSGAEQERRGLEGRL